MDENSGASVEAVEHDIGNEKSQVLTILEAVEPNHVLELPHGKELRSAETYPITATEKSKLIAVLGARGSGKTTLITAMYEQFLQEELLSKYCFSGSMTLDAFEQRAYNTRITCNRLAATMEHTSAGTLDKILHLRIVNFETQTYQNLLFADYSGEDYEAASADIDTTAEDFQLVKSAQSILLLLDGEKIANIKYRLMEIQKSIHSLRTFVDAGLINQNAQLVVVISKLDIIRKAETTGKHISVDDIGASILDQVPQLTGRITLYQVAPMPKDSSLVEIGYVIYDLFAHLVTTVSNKQLQVEFPVLTSQFNMWERRTIG